ncbi:MAG: lipopolysaccharide biosynthesis protein [Actinobacteria bacterium]|nr:lipopolysaccharide biosynthesis protein [Actinomycetota bacterium]
MSDVDDETQMEEARLERVVRHFRKGQLGNDAAWGTLHDICQLFVQTASFLLLGRRLGVEDYGRYAGVYGVVGPIGGLTWSGVTLAVLQRRLRERDSVRQTARDFFGYTIALGVCAVGIGTLIAGQIIGGLAITTIAAVMVAELFCNAVNQVSISMVQAEHGFAAATRLKMIILAIRVGVLLALVAMDSLTIAHLAIGFSVGFTVYTVALFRVILPAFGIRVELAPPSQGIFKVTGSISLPIAAGVLQQDGDKAVLNAYGFQHDAGLYAAAFRVVSMGLMPLRALEGAAFQRFLPHDENARNEHTRRAFRFSILALSGSVVVGIGVLVFAPLLDFLIGEDFAGAEAMIPWLLPFLPLTAIANAPSNGLLGLGRLGNRAAIYFGGASISLTSYIVFVPIFAEPWKGAVLGTILGEAFLVVAGWMTLLHFQRRHNRSLEVIDVST